METPLLASSTVTDPHIESVRAGTRFLQTSPEFAMKRMLAAGSGSIYQICKAFREGESGSRHNPEFTMLEWYRVGFDHHTLMDEVDLLLQSLLETEASDRVSYASVFRDRVGLDPHSCETPALAAAGARLGLAVVASTPISRADWLNLLMAQVIEPSLGSVRPTFVYDFPRELAALSRLRPDRPPVAERFELYFRGTELANGYHELTDAQEQRERFESDQSLRASLGRERVEGDGRLLAALEAGLPKCAGVALGFDRLVMVAAGKASLEDVLSFPIDRA